MSILDVQRRLTEVGRIRLGERGAKGAPRSLSTFRLTSASQSTLDAAAALYGGTVRRWEGAPSEGYFELVTEAVEIDVLIPPMEEVYSQHYELWASGACVRRCDGREEVLSGSACLCDPDARECDVVTRVNLMLPRLPGLGVWRLETGGWNAATTLPATLDLLRAIGTREFAPAVLRLEQRSKVSRENGRSVTHRFTVPVLDLPQMTIGQLVGIAVESRSAPVPQLGPVDRRERVERPGALPPPAETEPPVHRRDEAPAFPPPPALPDSSMEEIVAEAFDVTPEVAFKAAADAAGLSKADVATAGRKTYPGVAFRDYGPAHWHGLAAALGLEVAW